MRTAILALGLASVVHAADQTILGDSLQLKNPGPANAAKILVKATEPSSPDTVTGDPTATGATVTIRVSGGNSTSQTFNLPQGSSPSTRRQYWTGNTAAGFKYKDSKFENGPIKGASIRKTPSGVFRIKVLGTSKVAPISVLPPDPGTDGCMLLQIGGDSYSVRFAAADGTVTNKGATEYKHRKPSSEGTCLPERFDVCVACNTTGQQPCDPPSGPSCWPPVGQACNPIGQLCEPPFAVTVTTGSAIEARFAVGPLACMPFLVHARLDGEFVSTTPFSGAPNQDLLLFAITVSPGTHVLSLQAEGLPGGCNPGLTISWGGTLSVTR